MNSLELLALMHVRALPPRWDHPTPGDWANVLATFPLFAGVSKRRLRKLTRNATVAEFARGETIIFAGDRGSSLYIILGGKVEARPAGRTLHTGDYFGELASFDVHPRSATVVAMSAVHLMKIPSRSVLRLAREHPAIALTMFRDLAARLRQLETKGALRQPPIEAAAPDCTGGENLDRLEVKIV
jgi:CRP-like cAMP-binding protein